MCGNVRAHNVLQCAHTGDKFYAGEALCSNPCIAHTPTLLILQIIERVVPVFVFICAFVLIFVSGFVFENNCLVSFALLQLVCVHIAFIAYSRSVYEVVFISFFVIVSFVVSVFVSVLSMRMMYLCLHQAAMLLMTCTEQYGDNGNMKRLSTCARAHRVIPQLQLFILICNFALQWLHLNHVDVAFLFGTLPVKTAQGAIDICISYWAMGIKWCIFGA